MRSMMLTLNLQRSKFYVLNGIVAIITFFLVRILTIIPNWSVFFALIGTPQWYSIVLKYKIICVVSCIPLDCLNLFWFSKMITMAFKFARTSNKTSAKSPIESTSDSKLNKTTEKSLKAN